MRRFFCSSLRWLGVLLGCVLMSPMSAQSETLLVLDTPTTTLQTGQFYDITVGVENVESLWLADLEIAYDPTHLYIAGTQSGQPIQMGAFFAPSNLTTIIRNTVDGDRLIYTASLLNPAEAARGSGSLGTFRVYPLQSGPTQLTFYQAQLTNLTFTTDSAGQRIPGPAESVAFTPILLNLQVEGDTVSAPSEATATPLPTFTPAPDGASIVDGSPTALPNATRSPGSTSAASEGTADTASTSPVALIIGAVLVLVSGGLLIVMFRRR